MSRFYKVAAAITLMGIAPPAFAQHATPGDLDRLSQERMEDIGPRDWGTPVNPPATANTEKALPVSVSCMSPLDETTPLYSAPNINATKLGRAGSQLAVTSTEVNGWRQVLLNGTHMAWIQTSLIGPYKPLNPEHPVGCIVTGERADGTVLFTHPRQ